MYDSIRGLRIAKHLVGEDAARQLRNVLRYSEHADDKVQVNQSSTGPIYNAPEAMHGFGKMSDAPGKSDSGGGLELFFMDSSILNEFIPGGAPFTVSARAYVKDDKLWFNWDVSAFYDAITTKEMGSAPIVIVDLQKHFNAVLSTLPFDQAAKAAALKLLTDDLKLPQLVEAAEVAADERRVVMDSKDGQSRKSSRPKNSKNGKERLKKMKAKTGKR